MKKSTIIVLASLVLVLAGSYWATSFASAGKTGAVPSLVGAWQGHVQVRTGAFAAVKDLGFLYVFNAGGTMTESSNYDDVPPVPPAYGIWKKTGPREYLARYSFFLTKAPAEFKQITEGGGWMPAGHGVLVEKITLSADGNSYHSTLTLDTFDASGKPVETGTEAVATATRMRF